MLERVGLNPAVVAIKIQERFQRVPVQLELELLWLLAATHGSGALPRSMTPGMAMGAARGTSSS